MIKEKSMKDDKSLLCALNQKKFSYPFIRDQVKAFMFAGYDTTASSLIFAMDSIARISSVQEKIKKEEHLDYISSLYTQAAYKESLRLYPSAYFLPRQAIKDDSILGQKIKAGSQIFISIRHIQQNPEVFKNPENFDPNRFLKEIPHSHGFIPFGGGSRICIGASVATMEATVVLKTLCSRYKIQAVSQKAPEIEGLITAHTKSPLYVRLEKRVKSC